MANNIIDLTHPMDESTPPFPGNPPVEIGILAEIPENHPAGTNRDMGTPAPLRPLSTPERTWMPPSTSTGITRQSIGFP